MMYYSLALLFLGLGLIAAALSLAYANISGDDSLSPDVVCSAAKMALLLELATVIACVTAGSLYGLARCA